MEQLPKIVQQRLQATAAAGVHPDPDLLTAFAEKSLTERERTQVLQHLGQCADCRQVVGLAMPETVEPSPIPARAPWFSWPVLRWGALAACVAVVSAAVTLHYERRESAERVITQSTPAPAAPAPTPPETSALQGQVAKQLDQKFAAKIPPPSPFQSDRDALTAGKLAKQRDDTTARAAAVPSVSKNFEVAGVGERQAENNRGSGGKGIDQGTIDQLKRQSKNEQAKDEPSKAGQLNDNRLAMAQSDAINTDAMKTDATRTEELKSANKPATVPAGQMAASAPAPAAESKSGDKEAQAKPPIENPGSVFGTVNETVTVEAEATQVQTSQASVGRAKKPKKESRTQVQSAAAAEQSLPIAGRNVANMTTLTKIVPKLDRVSRRGRAAFV